jgi:hypothetical protein
MADDGQPAIATDFADEGAHLGGAHVDPDQDRFSLHVVVRPPR